MSHFLYFNNSVFVLKYMMKGVIMRKFIPVTAAVLVSLGFIMYSIITNESGTSNGKLINPGDVNMLNITVSGEGLASGKYIKVFVNRVVDGDTIDITYQKKDYKVRLLYIDTPESVKEGVEIQPYSIEASKITKKLVLRKNVKLIFEKGLRDKYSRLLAYVILEDGRNVNALLVRNGYARVEAVSPNTKNKDYFIELQQKAINDKLGVWSQNLKNQPFVKNNKGEYIPGYWNRSKAS